MSICKHGVSIYSSASCYNCVIEENEQLKKDKAILMDAMMSELPDDPKRPDTAEAYAKEFEGCTTSWEKTVRMALEERDRYKEELTEAKRTIAQLVSGWTDELH